MKLGLLKLGEAPNRGKYAIFLCVRNEIFYSLSDCGQEIMNQYASDLAGLQK